MPAQVSQIQIRWILQKLRMEIAYEIVWESYGNRTEICRRKFRKSRFGGSCGNSLWGSLMKSYGNRMEYAGASFTNSDSADLAEIANGNRMEYTGASFANSDSADLAQIAYGNRMEIVWNMPAQVSQIQILRILQK